MQFTVCQVREGGTVERDILLSGAPDSQHGFIVLPNVMKGLKDEPAAH